MRAIRRVLVLEFQLMARRERSVTGVPVRGLAHHWGSGPQLAPAEKKKKLLSGAAKITLSGRVKRRSGSGVI